jgi:hypothetical protein
MEAMKLRNSNQDRSASWQQKSARTIMSLKCTDHVLADVPEVIETLFDV